MGYFTCNTYNKGRTRNGWVLKSLVLGQGRHPAPPGRVVVCCRRDGLWQSPSRSHIVGQAIFFCNKPLKKSIFKKISAEECYGQHYAVISLFQPPYHGKGHLPLEHVVSSFIQPGIKHLLELNVINSFSPVKEKMDDMEFKAALLPQRDEC